nr:hypothetical protein [Tanacetum cinerariifolium]
MSSPDHSTYNNEAAFSSNISDYVSTIPDYFLASLGKTYSNALNNSTGLKPLEPGFEFDDQEWVEMGSFLFVRLEMRSQVFKASILCLITSLSSCGAAAFMEKKKEMWPFYRPRDGILVLVIILWVKETLQVMDTGCRLFLVAEGKVSSIPTILSWIDIISSDGFLPFILLVVVIMVTVIIVAVVLEIVVVVIVGVVIVVGIIRIVVVVRGYCCYW